MILLSIFCVPIFGSNISGLNLRLASISCIFMLIRWAGNVYGMCVLYTKCEEVYSFIPEYRLPSGWHEIKTSHSIHAPAYGGTHSISFLTRIRRSRRVEKCHSSDEHGASISHTKMCVHINIHSTISPYLRRQLPHVPAASPIQSAPHKRPGKRQMQLFCSGSLDHPVCWTSAFVYAWLPICRRVSSIVFIILSNIIRNALRDSLLRRIARTQLDSVDIFQCVHVW